MGKSKPKRTLQQVGESQRATEKGTRDKFAETQSVAKGKQERTPSISIPSGRVSPQLSCTIEPEDKQTLNRLAIRISSKMGKLYNTSSIVRLMIRLSDKNEDLLMALAEEES